MAQSRYVASIGPSRWNAISPSGHPTFSIRLLAERFAPLEVLYSYLNSKYNTILIRYRIQSD